jgi:serine/threonine protein kinase
MIGKRTTDPESMDKEAFSDDDYTVKKILKTEDRLENKENLDSSRQEQHNQLKYRMAKEIGKGTFGVVFKAKNTYLNSTVAIKKTAQDPRNTNREF